MITPLRDTRERNGDVAPFWKCVATIADRDVAEQIPSSSAVHLRDYPDVEERIPAGTISTIQERIRRYRKGRKITSIPTKPNALRSGERRRWYVHLTLLVSLVGSLLSLIYLSHSITLHVVFGVVFMVMLLFHFFQRRRIIKSLLKRLVGRQSRVRVTTRLAVSDIILELLVLDVLVSGIVDGVHHQATQFPFASALGLPPGLSQWHKLAALVLVGYAIVHVIRRRKRLRRSHIQ
jgi:hypothetical protein